MNRFLVLLAIMILVPIVVLAQDYTQYYHNAKKRYDRGLYESAYKNYDLYVDLTSDLDTAQYIKYLNMVAAEHAITREREFKNNPEMILALSGFINFNNPSDSLSHDKVRDEWETIMVEKGKRWNEDCFIDLTHHFQDANTAIEVMVTNWMVYDDGFDRDEVKCVVDSLSLSNVDRRLYFVNGVFIHMVWNGNCYISTMPITECLYYGVIMNNPICGYKKFDFETYGNGKEKNTFLKRLNKISGMHFVSAVGDYLVLYDI